ncbi:fibronectin type III domain-containing protein [Cereibacter azotoformans]|uniref:fibronectin type III domain-containing protein n=1 Tax=Cereibacter azotoformans TaxID=43057 RepID=UPI0015F2FEF7|nr:fibronectin type III domain-containing protein [Cereibacter azotoformans]UIJ31523.1 fibronectin type III domain-containing protein [Cereibacter azotoformans]
MRRVIIAALLSTTAIVSSADEAHADPVSAFIGGFFASIGATAATGAVAAALGGAAAAGFATGTFLLTTIVGKTLLSIGLSIIAQKLTQKSFDIPSPAERKVNFAQDLAPMEWVYGRVRKGGPLAFTGFARTTVQINTSIGVTLTKKKSRRHYAVLIAAHRTKGPVTHYLDKWEVDVNATGAVISTPAGGEDGVLASIRPYTGKPAQAADPLLVETFPAVTSAHDFAGLSYAVLYAGRPAKDGDFQKVFPNAREWTYNPIWDGHDRIYDPRTGAYGWTRNAALIIAHNCLRYGKAVHWPEVAAQADICDQTVTNASGGTQPRWTIDGVFLSTEPWEQVRDRLALACDAWFYERPDGSVGFKVGAWEEPTVTLTDRDFLSIEISEGDSSPDVPGEFAVRYIEPAYDYGEQTCGAIVMEPNSARSVADSDLITSHNQAVRIAKRLGRAQRPKYTIAGQLKLIGYELIGQRFVRIELAELGISCNVEVGRLVRESSRISFSLEATSATAEDFAFVAATEEPPRPARGSVESSDDIETPASLTGQVVTQTGGTAIIRWLWPAQDEDYVQQLQWRVNGGPWEVLTAGRDQTSLTQGGLVDGGVYEAQIRNRTASGRTSSWYPTDPVSVTAIANTTPPGSLSGFDGLVIGGAVSLTWEAPNDARYFAARIWRSETTVFADAIVVRTEYGIPSNPDGYVDNPGVGTWTYWAEGINASGIAGPRSGPVTKTVV